MLSRYGSMSAMDLPAEDFIPLMRAASDKESREQIKREWDALLPWMTAELLNYMPFSDYYEHRTGAGMDLRSKEEILADVEEVRKELAGGTV